MNLSNRLQAIATLVDVNARVIDVGCDHAYLDVYLTQNNGNVCIATDINKNALEIAKINIDKYGLKAKITTVLTNGLTNLNVEPSDNIVIAGMGTFTILDILKTNTLSNTLILASNNNIDILRSRVVKLGYVIDSELFLIDKGKPYIIIKFVKGYKRYSKKDIKVGPILKNNIEYKKYLNAKYDKILKSISKKKVFLRFKYKFKKFFY